MKNKLKKKSKIEVKPKIESQIESNEISVEPEMNKKAERLLEENNKYNKNEINWLEDKGNFWDWNKIKGHIVNLMCNQSESKWYFLSHNNDFIKGKPQLIDNVMKKIPLMKVFENKKEIKYYKFFDDSYDKRGLFQKDSFGLDFWLYKVVSNNKEYCIFSQKKLPNCVCEFKGMFIEVDDFAEINNSLRLNSISRIFLLKDFIPDIKILAPKELIKFTKSKGFTKCDWLNHLAFHPNKNYNRFPDEVEELRSSQILSGEKDKYPLHIFVWGSTGTKKTSGIAETIGYKFDENFDICEGGNSRMKGLIPSFKDKPAKLGYIAESERIGIVDEIGKMIERMSEVLHNRAENSLGDINFLLEHKRRRVGSGNEDIDVEATAKYIFITNPIMQKKTIYEHVGLVDPSTLSRFLNWVQDKNEIEFCLSENSIEKKPRGECNKKISREEFLSIFDSCYDFLCEIDEEEIKRIFLGVTSLVEEPMKSSVWKPRAIHHIELLIDGICKARCLFEDYDDSFKANKFDYEKAERILIRMVNGWKTDLSPKGKWTGF